MGQPGVWRGDSVRFWPAPASARRVSLGCGAYAATRVSNGEGCASARLAGSTATFGPPTRAALAWAIDATTHGRHGGTPAAAWALHALVRHARSARKEGAGSVLAGE